MRPSIEQRKRCLLLTLALVGCGGTDPTLSTDLESIEIKLAVTVQSNGEIAFARASASDLEGASVTLGATDSLRLTAGGEESTFTPLDDGYFGAVRTSGTELSVILEREGGSRVVSDLALPPPFALFAPAAPASRSSPITLTWTTGTGFDVALQIQSPCFPRIDRAPGTDTGVYSIQPAEIPAVQGECEVVAQVTRTWRRDLSIELAPNYPASLQQVRTTRFITLP